MAIYQNGIAKLHFRITQQLSEPVMIGFIQRFYPSQRFIIGDRFGRSCVDALSWAVIELLQNMGYNVAHNKPYAGGYITEHYGRPHRDCP